MKLMFVLYFVFVSSCLSAGEAVIKLNTDSTLKAEVKSSYVMGDADSRLDAKNLALQSAKQAAAELAGTYIESKLIIDGNKVEKEVVESYTAAFVGIELLDESVKLNSAGQSVYELTVLAEIDKGALREKIKQVQLEPERKRQISDLRKENAKLRNELTTLSDQLNRASSENKDVNDIKARRSLYAKREEVLSDINQNTQSMRQVFKKGTLFSLAKKSSNEFEHGKTRIEKDVWGHIKSNAEVTLSAPEFRDNEDGTFDILVTVIWDVDAQPIEAVLNDYFREYNEENIRAGKVDFSDHMGNKAAKGIVLARYANSKEDQKRPFSEKLFLYIASKSIVLTVRADKYSGGLTLAEGRRCFVSCSGNGNDQYHMHLSNKGATHNIISYSQQNPIVIKNVPERVLQELTTIEYEIVISG